MFYVRLKQACAQKGISLTALLRQLDLSSANTGKWKNGGMPSVEVLLQISEELGVSTDYLIKSKENNINTKENENMFERFIEADTVRVGLYAYFYDRYSYFAADDTLAMKKSKIEQLSEKTKIEFARLETFFWLAFDFTPNPVLYPNSFEFDVMMYHDMCEEEGAINLLNRLNKELELLEKKERIERLEAPTLGKIDTEFGLSDKLGTGNGA